MARKIPENATVEDVLQRLQDADKYLSGIVGNMVGWANKYGGARVRIGITGEGLIPHYRIEPSESFLYALEKIILEGAEDDLTRYYVAYNGRNHKQFDWGKTELNNRNWSSRSMTFEEVRRLLGKVRGK